MHTSSTDHDETLNAIFYNPDHTKRYNPSGKPTGVVLTDFDIMEAKQAIMQLIKEDRERAVREARIDELEIITDHYTPYRPFLDDDKNVNIRRYCTDRIAELSNPTQEKE